jgi:hypothetical protein
LSHVTDDEKNREIETSNKIKGLLDVYRSDSESEYEEKCYSIGDNVLTRNSTDGGNDNGENSKHIPVLSDGKNDGAVVVIMRDEKSDINIAESYIVSVMHLMAKLTHMHGASFEAKVKVWSIVYCRHCNV